MWYQVVELTSQIGARVASGLISKLDVESEILDLPLRGGFEMDLSQNVMDQIMIKGEINMLMNHVVEKHF
jgi:hypothetical protein